MTATVCSRRSRSVASVVAVAGVCLGVLAACGGDDTPGSEPVETVPASTTVVTTAPPWVAVVSVEDSVSYYPACGNEVLDHDGVRWYPVAHVGSSGQDDELQARLEALLAVEREPIPMSEAQGFARVVPPGPGDDTGTLVVWADGVARWTSDSGDLDVWLVDDKYNYNWVC